MSNKRHPQDNHKAANNHHPNCPRESYDNLSDALLNHIGLRLMIEQKITEASKEVGKEFKLYGGFVLAAIALVGIFGIKPLAEWYKQYIEEKVTEKYVSVAVQNQLNKFSSDTVQPLLDERINRAKQEVNVLSDSKMHALYEKALQIEKLAQMANEKFRLVEILLSATAGRRIDYDRLRKAAEGTNELSLIARNSLDQLNETYEDQKRQISDFNKRTMTRTVGGKTKKLHSDILINIIHGDYARNCEGALNDLAAKKKNCNIPTLIFAMRNTKYLRCMAAAIRGIEEISGEQFPVLGIDEVESWWGKHSTNSQFRSVLEEAITAMPKPNESATEFNKRVISLLDEDIMANQSHADSADRMIKLLLHLMRNISEKKYCKEPFERALIICEKDEDLHNAALAYKAIYIYEYERQKFVNYINERLKERPDFETELKQLNYFNNTFFTDCKNFNWPSHHLCTKPTPSKSDQR